MRHNRKDNQFPILAIAERNRTNIGGGFTAGAGTRKNEYGAETVIDLWCEDGPESTTGKVAVTVKLAMNRNEDPGGVDFAFHGAMQRFERLDDEYL